MAVIKSIQRGSATIAAGALSGTATITAVTTANSILFFTRRVATVNVTDASFGEIGGTITNTTTLTFTRYLDTGSMIANIEYFVVEFSSGVAVQRGTVSGSTVPPVNVTITAVTLANSWPICEQLNSGSNIGGDDFPQAKITTTTNLALTLGEAGANVIMYWQVVQYDNCTSTCYDTTLWGDETTRATTITSVNMVKTLLFDSYYIQSDCKDSDWPTTVLTNATTITFTKYSNISVSKSFHTTYVVQFADAVQVQRAETALASGDTSATPSINQVDLNMSMAHVVGGYNSLSRTDYITDDRFSLDAHTITFNSNVQLNINRAASDAASNLSWEVMEWSVPSEHSVMRGTGRGIMRGVG